MGAYTAFFCRWYFETVTIFTEYKREIKGQRRRSDWGGERKQHWLKFKRPTWNLHSRHLKHHSLNIELQSHFFISCKSFKNALNYWEFKSSISRDFFPDSAILKSAINWFIVGVQQLSSSVGMLCSLPAPFQAAPVPRAWSHPCPTWAQSQLWEHLGTVPRGALGLSPGSPGSARWALQLLLCQGSACCSSPAMRSE